MRYIVIIKNIIRYIVKDDDNVIKKGKKTCLVNILLINIKDQARKIGLLPGYVERASGTSAALASMGCMAVMVHLDLEARLDPEVLASLE